MFYLQHKGISSNPLSDNKKDAFGQAESAEGRYQGAPKQDAPAQRQFAANDPASSDFRQQEPDPALSCGVRESIRLHENQISRSFFHPFKIVIISIPHFAELSSYNFVTGRFPARASLKSLAIRRIARLFAFYKGCVVSFVKGFSLRWAEDPLAGLRVLRCETGSENAGSYLAEIESMACAKALSYSPEALVKVTVTVLSDRKTITWVCSISTPFTERL